MSFCKAVRIASCVTILTSTSSCKSTNSVATAEQKSIEANSGWIASTNCYNLVGIRRMQLCVYSWLGEVGSPGGTLVAQFSADGKTLTKCEKVDRQDGNTLVTKSSTVKFAGNAAHGTITIGGFTNYPYTSANMNESDVYKKIYGQDMCKDLTD